ncbi:MAG: hypothetical protein HFF90_10575 [Oscillibacter sp.]|nr:hypothetical protein [Oscillibacter sp.]
MVLIQKRCEQILSAFQKEICLDPDAVCDPYIQNLSNLFGSIRKRCEGKVVANLFLNLYGLDAPALRRDFCTCVKPGAAGVTGPRAKLLWYLYGAVALYLNGVNYSTLTTPASIPAVQMDQKRCEAVLLGFKKEVCRRQDPDFSRFIMELMRAAAFRGIEKKCERNVVDTLFLKLYQQDAQSLRRDLLKCETIGPGKAPPSQRADLLQFLYDALSTYIGEDFSPIIEMCDRVEGL